MAEDTTRQVPWLPITGVIIVVVLYLLAPTLGGLLVSLYPAARGWSTAQSNGWLNNSVIAQFWYVLLAEAFTVAGLVIFLKRYKVGLAILGFKRLRLKDVGLGLLFYPVYFILFAIVIVIATQLIPGLNVDQKQELGFDNVAGTLPLVLTFFSLVVLPPIVEELTVRGLLFTSLRKRSTAVVATILTSLIFAAAHLPEGGAAGPLYIAAIDTFLLSLALCWLREKTGSLWPGITLHALKNGIAYLSLFIFPLLK